MRGGSGRQGIRFILVGLASTGLYFLLLQVLRDRVANILLLTGLCYLTSMVFNFLLQSRITFAAGPPTRRNVSRFIVMQLTALCANSLLMALLVERLGLPLVYSQIAVTACISVLVFVTSKLWVYRQ